MADDDPPAIPFPDSICHGCAAPPKYVRSARAVFILCPILPDKYPRQPVLRCPHYVPASDAPAN